jgi:quercetin dioxygenase-like cupin family protein
VAKLKFQLDSLLAKEIYDDVLVRIVNGKELTINYFELKTREVNIPKHIHPVEHLVIVMKGKMEFLIEDQKIILKKKDCLFVPAKKRHTAKVINGPVKALEIFILTKDKYYEK